MDIQNQKDIEMRGENLEEMKQNKKWRIEMDRLNQKGRRNDRGKLGRNTREQELENRDGWRFLCNS